MKIGLIGSGGVARTLAKKFSSDGYEVMIGTRDVAESLARNEPDASGNPPLGQWLAEHPEIKLENFEDTAAFGEVLFLATVGLAVLNAIDLADKDNFDGKIVVDLTNPLDFSEGIPPKFAASPGNSLGEQIQRYIPTARVVKAFNTIGSHIIVNPKREEGTPDLLIAGNDPSAKQWVTDLALSWGWNSTVDLGGIENAYWLEAHAMLWIVYAFKNDWWDHAFKFLRK
ncbi:MAG: NADP oxidoreductase [Methanobacteriota archaeon]|nr:MAG: NADP oxidoreductase [Euryarchaeota archaeon]